MNRLIFTIICPILTTVLLLVSCDTEIVPQTGSIYGVVADKATGEPIASAGVELQPVGLKTVTGSEGQFEFTDIDAGKYNLFITKTGYAELKSSVIVVKAGQTAKGDVQIEKLPPALRVVNDKQKDISEIDFGGKESDIARSFSIFNDGSETLEWQIVKTAEWILSISKTEGTLKAGASQAVVMTIDRSKLASGENVTTVHVTSNDGAKPLTVKATNGTVMATLNTLAVTDIHTSSATFNGEILTKGTPHYTERGFVYSTSSMPTIENSIRKLTVAVNETIKYSAIATGLDIEQTYYVRAYAVNSAGVAYSTNEESFQPQKTLPVVQTKEVTNVNIGAGVATFTGIIVERGDPAYTERGFVYGQVHNPTVDDDTKKPVSGSGIGEFSTNISGLTMGEVYYVRAYATNETGTAYGEELPLPFDAVMPVVTTGEGKITSESTATLKGTIDTVGDPAYTERGFVYGSMPVPTLDNGAEKIVAAGTGTGPFIAYLTDFTSSATTLYYRAYAQSSAGVVYGEIRELISEEYYEYMQLPTFEFGGHTYRVYPDIGAMDWFGAMDACENLSFAGYDDWKLPDRYELRQMAEKGLLSIGYEWWSGTQFYTYYRFYSGASWQEDSYNSGSYTFHVRPVRIEK